MQFAYLTAGQFVVAQVFIIGKLTVGKQVNFALNKDLGFRKYTIVYFETNRQDTDLDKLLPVAPV